MPKRLLVTAALPYANGSIHLGHLLEYTQADIYVRALKRLGVDAVYLCADDAHGTPIELNAKKLGLTPEQMVESIHAEHQKDFATFDIAFDFFGLTHSDTNRKLVNEVYAALRKGGHLDDRDIDGNFCETDQRFLPDRFVKGTCPRCGTKDQYGDVCESCKATYQPTDLVEPRCVLCGNRPVVRSSRHVFFKLSAPSRQEFLRTFVDSGALQPDVGNYVRAWIDKGLEDWCISRDAPYFGFEIPDRPGKFFYVWLDAPLEYIAAALDWGKIRGLGLDDLMRSPDTELQHIIGKDIVYFHTLFWPAVLEAAGFNRPSKVMVHGMLTVDGQKMSKSRGTFINAKTFAAHVEPQVLRYFLASKLGTEASDLDLSLDEVVHRVNSELVNKHANLFSRAAQFLQTRLDAKLGELPFSAADALKAPSRESEPATTLVASSKPEDWLELARRVTAACRRAEAYYRDRNFAAVVRELSQASEIGNEVMQAQKPWDQMKADPEAARRTCTFALNVCHALAMYLWPIVPRFADAGARILARPIERMRLEELFTLRNHTIGPMERLFERIEKKALDAVVEASRDSLGAAPSSTTKTTAVAPPSNTIGIDSVQAVDLRVGIVTSAEAVKKSNKLLRLEVDLGEGAPRQILAGIALAYRPEQILGKRLVIVTNLAPRALMGITSNGMVLCAGEAENLRVLTVDGELPAGASIR